MTKSDPFFFVTHSRRNLSEEYLNIGKKVINFFVTSTNDENNNFAINPKVLIDKIKK